MFFIKIHEEFKWTSFTIFSLYITMWRSHIFMTWHWAFFLMNMKHSICSGSSLLEYDSITLKTIQWCSLTCKHLQKLGIKAKHWKSWVAPPLFALWSSHEMWSYPHIPFAWEALGSVKCLDKPFWMQLSPDDIGWNSSGTDHYTFSPSHYSVKIHTWEFFT